MLKYSLILLLIFFSSCGSRKVVSEKTNYEVKKDSISIVKKKEVIITENNISINTDIDEIEITPIDVEKPIVINDKKYYNAKIKAKKTKIKLLDNTNKKEIKKDSSEIKVITNKKEIKEVRKVDRKQNYLSFLWWILLIAVIIYLYRRYKNILF